MALNHSPKIVTDGLVFAYDMGNTEKSWKGQPTTNLVGDSMSIYNNVPGDVTATLVTTGEYYRGAPIYMLTLTPTTTAGVSYLTAGNNPGLGVVSSGGGGTANRYTGHSIFFKPTVTMHSSPIYTHYSNIAGWQSTSNYYSMGDGWFRAHVIWYDTTTRSDGKYWAINPASATINVPIVTYFAGPFKEDRNDSTMVAQYVYGTRSNAQALIDLTGNNTITATSLTYASDGTFSFNGSSDYCDVSGSGFVSGMTGYTICYWAKRTTGNRMPVAGRTSTAFYWYGDNSWAYTHGGTWGEYYYPKSVSIPDNTWGFFCCTYDGSNVKIYRNGVYEGQQATTGTADWAQGMRIGYWTGGNGYQWSGNIGGVNFYNRALSAAEVKQNFNALRGRYGI